MLLLILLLGSLSASPLQETPEDDADAPRKILGSSVVTSVSVIMDGGNGSQTYFADAVGKPVSKPVTGSQLASPIDLLNPDRYEFFTFDDNGDLVKRLMTLEEIQGIIANGDGEDAGYDSATYMPQKKVNDIVNNVQNVLKEEIKTHGNGSLAKPILDTPDVSSTWSMILPAIFSNSGEEITLEKMQTAATPETVTVDQVSSADGSDERPKFNVTLIEKHEEEIEPIYINIPGADVEKGQEQTIATPQADDTPIITVEIISDVKRNSSAAQQPPLVTFRPSPSELEDTKNIERVPDIKEPLTKTTSVPITSSTKVQPTFPTTTSKDLPTTEEIPVESQSAAYVNNRPIPPMVKLPTTSRAPEVQMVKISTIRPSNFAQKAKPSTASATPSETKDESTTKAGTESNSTQKSQTAQQQQQQPGISNSTVNSPVQEVPETTTRASSEQTTPLPTGKLTTSGEPKPIEETVTASNTDEQYASEVAVQFTTKTSATTTNKPNQHTSVKPTTPLPTQRVEITSGRPSTTETLGSTAESFDQKISLPPNTKVTADTGELAEVGTSPIIRSSSKQPTSTEESTLGLNDDIKLSPASKPNEHTVLLVEQITARLPTQSTEQPTRNTQVPTKSTKLPTEVTKVPTNGTKLTADTNLPARGTRRPTTNRTKLPTTGTTAPMNGQQLPTYGTKLPTTGAKPSLSGTKAPSGVQLPESGTKVPTTDTNSPTNGAIWPTEDVKPQTTDSVLPKQPTQSIKLPVQVTKLPPTQYSSVRANSTTDGDLFETSASTAFLQDNQKTKTTTPVLLIIKENLNNEEIVGRPEASTQGFLSTFFFIGDRNHHKHQTTAPHTLISSTTENGVTADHFQSSPLNKSEVPTITPTFERNNSSPLVLEKHSTSPAQTNAQIFTAAVDDITDNPINNRHGVTEILDQLLLSSTNIYELNAQLADITNAAESTDATDWVNQLESTTTSNPPALYTVSDETTERNLIASIEQLMSQAIGEVEEPIVNVQNNEKVEEALAHMNSKPMQEVRAESATVGSVLLDNRNGEAVESTEGTIFRVDNTEMVEEVQSTVNSGNSPTTDSGPEVQNNENFHLSGAVDSIISQVYGPEQDVVTTTEISNSKNSSASEGDSATAHDVGGEDATSESKDVQEIKDEHHQKVDENHTTPSKVDDTLDYGVKDEDAQKEDEVTETGLKVAVAGVQDIKGGGLIHEGGQNTDENGTTYLRDEGTNAPKVEENEDYEMKNETQKIYLKVEGADTQKLKMDEDESLKTDDADIQKIEIVDGVQDKSELDVENQKVKDGHAENAETVLHADDVDGSVLESHEVNISAAPGVFSSLNKGNVTNTKENQKQEIIGDENTFNASLKDDPSKTKIEEHATVIEIVANKTAKVPDVTLEVSTGKPEHISNIRTASVENQTGGYPSTTQTPKEPNITSVYEIITSTAKYADASTQTIPFGTRIRDTTRQNATLNTSSAKVAEKITKTDEASSSISPMGTEPPTENRVATIKDQDADNKNSTWTLVPTVLPHSNSTPPPVEPKPEIHVQPPTPVKLNTQPMQGFGLEDSTSKLDTDIYQFVELCNELSFGFWNAVTTGISSARSVFVSPFAATSLLAMVFLGARGATSGEMNEILKLDDMVTFNPHLIFKNVSESIDVSRISGVATSVIARELYSDRGKGKLLSFYKERARQFYDGHVEEVGFREIGDIIRRRTNLLVKKYTLGKIQEYVKDSSVTVRPPLAGVSASIFQTDCTGASVQGRDGELYFVVLPSVRQRRLIPIPAVVYSGGFLAGYEPTLDATAAAIGTTDQIVSTIFVIPGQQGVAAPGDGLTRLERHLVESSFKLGSWSRLLKSLIPRPGLELQIPRFSHRSIINATVALQNMGLRDLFRYDKADLRGLNGVAHELHLSDILQINNFATCGEGPVGEHHHSEMYPATARRPSRRSRRLEYVPAQRIHNDADLEDEPRDYQRAFHDPLHDPDLFALPLSLRPRQARIPDTPRLRFDRPFLFFVRHNPTGLILHMGRFNPRLLP